MILRLPTFIAITLIEIVIEFSFYQYNGTFEFSLGGLKYLEIKVLSITAMDCRSQLLAAAAGVQRSHG